MSDILTELKGRVPAEIMRPPLPHYLEEPRGRWRGQAAAILAPTTTAEVAEILRACSKTGTPVVPFGGGTGLVGGQLLPNGTAPVVLSLERMNDIGPVDAEGQSVTVGAGAILADVHAAAEARGLVFPLTLASQGSARIGGLLATNAGGVGVIRYGNARDLCLGLEAVLPDGQVMAGLKALRKDNTGYDLRHLLIGAEGTLGVITQAVLRLYPQPKDRAVALFVVPDPTAALRLLRMSQAQIGPGLSAFELISGQGLDFLVETGIDSRAPFAPRPDWMCLIDVGLAQAQPVLETLFEAAQGASLTTDGVVSQSEAQRQAIWDLRERLPEANRKIGAISSHDISVPVAAIPDFIAQGPGVIGALGTFRINCFGHLGDGNLHYNVFPIPGETRADHADKRDAIKRAVHNLVDAFGGSVSAEHGIGRLKVNDLERYGDPGKLAAMRAIKAALDPKGIMNPGAVLRPRP
ncbi:MAG: FAD-binding oxidoreductase [Pseudomonadota bacterium]